MQSNPQQTGQRRDRLIREMVHDPYKTKPRPVEPTVCPVCRAVYRAGRWQWADSWPFDAHQQMCQACHRIRDNYPAGLITFSGAFVEAHRAEMISLARNLEEKARAEHPLQRIMAVEEGPNRLVIKTTDIHLPHRIAEATHKAFKGQVQQHYDEEGYFVRVNWVRET